MPNSNHVNAARGAVQGLNFVWDTNLLEWVPELQPSTSGGGGGGGTEYTEGVASPANPVAGALNLRYRDALIDEGVAPGGWITANVTQRGEIYVRHVDDIAVSVVGGILGVQNAPGLALNTDDLNLQTVVSPPGSFTPSLVINVQGDPAGLPLPVSSPTYEYLFDYVAGTNPIYMGSALPGSATASSVWQIKKFTFDGNDNVTGFTFAGGSASFTNAWDSRASYTYS